MSVFSRQTAQIHTASAPRVEIMAFRRITVAFEQAQSKAHQDPSRQPTKATQRHVRPCDAVHRNMRLWLTLEDPKSPASRPPGAPRARLASLVATSVRHYRRIRADQATLKLLIDISSAIAVGLMQARAAAAKSVSMEGELRYAGGQT